MPFAELLLRKSLAGFASRRLQPRAPVSLGGPPTPAWRADKSGAILVDVEAALRALAIQPNFDHAKGHVRFTRSGKAYLLLLASAKYKENGSWKILPDMVMLRDGRWFAPVEAFGR
jgi:hypothetical protein